MALKLRWDVDADSWRAVARFLGLTLKAFSDGDWCVVNQHDADSVMLKTAEPRTLTAAQEAAETAAARMLAEDEGVRALLVGQWRSPDELEAANVRALAMMDELDALRARVAELEAAQRWVPVAEGLPDVDTLALAVDVSGTVDVVRYHGQHWNPYVRDTLPYWGGWDDITHWRPLPAGPEVQP